jgi:hypothetical protein
MLTYSLVLYSLAEAEPHEGKRKVESLWPIFKIHHQRARYVYDLYYRRKAISKGKPQYNTDPCVSFLEKVRMF